MDTIQEIAFSMLSVDYSHIRIEINKNHNTNMISCIKLRMLELCRTLFL